MNKADFILTSKIYGIGQAVGMALIAGVCAAQVELWTIFYTRNGGYPEILLKG
jgi:hypothetical protein